VNILHPTLDDEFSDQHQSSPKLKQSSPALEVQPTLTAIEKIKLEIKTHTKQLHKHTTKPKKRTTAQRVSLARPRDFDVYGDLERQRDFYKSNFLT
jgi:hypothetical protein